MRKSSVLQALRGLAAVAVVLCHLSRLLNRQSPFVPIFSNFALAVDVFFIISGFVIAVSTADPAKSSPVSFLTRRLFRVVPLAWINIILFTLILHVDHGLVLRGFLFLPENPDNGLFPLNFPQWTLSYEIFFYLMFCISIGISHKYRCEICIALVLFIFIADCIVPQSSDPIRAYFRSDLFLEFASGIVIARLVSNLPQGMPRSWSLGAGAVAIGGGLVLCTFRPLASGLFDFGGGAAFILGGMLLIEHYNPVPIPRWLDALGELSYAIYISQAFAVIYVDSKVFWTPIYRTWVYQHSSGGSRLILILVVTLLIGVVLHVTIEKPGIRLGRRLADLSRPQASRLAS